MTNARHSLPSLVEALSGSISESLEYIIASFRTTPDPRVGDWLLMSSAYPTIVLCVLYLLIVWLGPKYMANHQPFSLKYTLVTYNFLLVLLSAYMVYEFVATTFMNPGFNIWCSPVDRSDDVKAVRLAKVIWWYYFSKLIEFLDTFFFILRKKDSQVTFLHVYHHSTMPLLWWVAARYLPGGSAFFSATLNSGVHVLMYAYYMFSAMGPHMKKYLWWKKYITAAQLTQFWTILAHTSYAMWLDCWPNAYGVALILYTLSHILLFSNFYNKAYRVGKDTMRALSPRANMNRQSANGTHKKTN